MRLIRKTAAPSSFQKYIKKATAAYLEIDKDVKDELLASLVAEQNGICAYCQQVLVEGKITIEHHCERSICNGKNGTIDRQLDYTNLFAVCLGKRGINNEFHCDTQKATFSIANGLPIEFLPTTAAHISTIRYATTGRINSTNESFKDEVDRILNLNIDYLKDARKKKWLLFFKNSLNKKGIVNKKKMKKLIEADLAMKNGKFINPFVGLSEYMQRKFC